MTPIFAIGFAVFILCLVIGLVIEKPIRRFRAKRATRQPG